jgi:FkbM family methyltransferase
MTSIIIFLKRFIQNLVLIVAPSTSSRKYLRYKIFHHKQDELIKEINRSHKNIYEESETKLIVEHLQHLRNPVVLDIGANIGLISLNICHYVSHAVCYAFEPSPIQFGYLLKNLKENKLEDRIYPFNIALGDHTGVARFYTHGPKNSSGDGLIDTGRAGPSSVIEVKMTTLDQWWLDNNKPEVSFLKLDTEGAELQVLKSAADFLRHCRPVVLIEICYLNYEKYGVTFEDHIQLLNDYQYTLHDLKKETIITKLNYGSFKEEFYYLALPNSLT